MKKFYFTSLLLSAAFASNAQTIADLHTFENQKLGLADYSGVVRNAKPTNNSEKALNIVWTEDFAGTNAMETGNGVWTVNGTNGAYWTISSAAHALSAFGYDHSLDARHLHWDSYTPNSAEAGGFASTAIDGEAISPSIDLSGLTNSIGIQFNTSAIYCCNYQYKPFGIAFSSDDGATWSNTLPIDFGADRNVPTEDLGDPLAFSVNLSSIATSLTATSKIKFVWDGLSPDGNGQFNTHYFWGIDDIAIYEIPDYDLEITSSYWGAAGLKYYQVPTTQVSPIDFSVNVANTGTLDITNAQLNVDVDAGATFAGTSTAVTVVSGATDSLALTTQYTPSTTVGTYAVTRALSMTETDDIPENNVLSGFTVEVTDHVYARDNGTADGSATSNGDVQFETGNYYDIYTDATAHGIQVQLGSTSPAQSEFIGKIYHFNPAGASYTEYMEYMEETPLVTSTAGMAGTVINLPFYAPVDLTAGETYYIVIESYTGDLRIGTAGDSDGNSIIYYDATAYNQPRTPMVRLHFGSTGYEWIGLEENDAVKGFGIYPNPAANEARVTFNVTNTTDVEIVVTDLAGKTIETLSLGSLTGSQNIALNTANYANGIYNVTINTNEGVLTQKLVKK